MKHRRVHTETLHHGRDGFYWWGQLTFDGGKLVPNRWGPLRRYIAQRERELRETT